MLYHVPLEPSKGLHDIGVEVGQDLYWQVGYLCSRGPDTCWDNCCMCIGVWYVFDTDTILTLKFYAS